MLDRLRALWEKTPPPPKIPALPEARGRLVPTVGYAPRYQLPPTPQKPRALTEAQARAARLRRLQPPRLERPRLHADHDHPNLAGFLELTTSYVLGEAPRLELATPSPWERHAIGDQLELLDARIKPNQWSHLHRLDDVRAALDLPKLGRTW